MIHSITRIIALIVALTILMPPIPGWGGGKRDKTVKEDVEQLAKDTKKAAEKSGPVIKKTAVKVGKDIKEGFKEVKKELKDKKD